LGKTVFAMPKPHPQNSPLTPLVIGLTQNPTPVCRCQTPQVSHQPTPSHQPATNQSAEPSPSPLGEPTNGTNGSTTEPSHEPTPSQTPTPPTEPSAQTAPNSTMPNPTQNPMPNIPPTQPQQPAPPNLKALALEALIGPRGTVKPSSGRNGNKNLIKKWLTEKGVAFSVSGWATVKELGAAYNDVTDIILNSMLQKSQTSGQQTPNQQTQQTPSAPTAQPTTPQTPKVSVPTPTVKKPKGPKVLIHKLHDKVVEAMMSGLGVMVFGPAGSGKTTLAESVAKTLNLTAYLSGAVRKDFKLFGFIDAHGNYRSTTFRDAFENGGLFLFDEIDASDAGVLLTLNAALANRVCDFPDKIVRAHPDFRFMASANTNGDGATALYSGRQKLDGATLDRFLITTCDYDNDLVISILEDMCKNPTDLAVCLDWNSDVCLIRKLAKENSIGLILSPRATFNGAKLLTAPNRKVYKTSKDLMDDLVWNKLSDENTRKRLQGLFKTAKAATPTVTA
jgi:hypothetical protein